MFGHCRGQVHGVIEAIQFREEGRIPEFCVEVNACNLQVSGYPHDKVAVGQVHVGHNALYLTVVVHWHGRLIELFSERALDFQQEFVGSTVACSDVHDPIWTRPQPGSFGVDVQAGFLHANGCVWSNSRVNVCLHFGNVCVTRNVFVFTPPSSSLVPLKCVPEHVFDETSRRLVPVHSDRGTKVGCGETVFSCV